MNTAPEFKNFLPEHPVLFLNSGDLRSDGPSCGDLGLFGTPDRRVPLLLDDSEGMLIKDDLSDESGLCLKALPQALA